MTTHAGNIAATVLDFAAQKGNASEKAGCVIECIVGACSPLFGSMFSDDTPHQDRLLFCLTLAGACSTVTEEKGDHFGLTVSIHPSTLSEAMRVYMQITGKDIRPHLPKNMVKFAESERLAMH